MCLVLFSDEKVLRLSDYYSAAPLMYSMFEHGIRRGQTFVDQHFVEKKTFVSKNGKEQRIHLVYFDQNNLYGLSLCKQLLYQDFSWGDPNLFPSDESILNLDDEGVVEEDELYFHGRSSVSFQYP